MKKKEYEHTVTLKFTAEAFEDIWFALMINRALQEADAYLEQFNGKIEIIHEEPFEADELKGD